MRTPTLACSLIVAVASCSKPSPTSVTPAGMDIPRADPFEDLSAPLSAEAIALAFAEGPAALAARASRDLLLAGPEGFVHVIEALDEGLPDSQGKRCQDADRHREALLGLARVGETRPAVWESVSARQILALVERKLRSADALDREVRYEWLLVRETASAPLSDGLWILLLADEQPFVAMRAISELKARGAALDCSALIEYLAHPLAKVRRDAARVLRHVASRANAERMREGDLDAALLPFEFGFLADDLTPVAQSAAPADLQAQAARRQAVQQWRDWWDQECARRQRRRETPKESSRFGSARSPDRSSERPL